MISLLLALAPQVTITPPSISLTLAPGEVQNVTLQVCVEGDFTSGIPPEDIVVAFTSIGLSPYLTQIAPPSHTLSFDPNLPNEPVCCDFIVTFEGDCVDDSTSTAILGALPLLINNALTDWTVPVNLYLDHCPPPGYEDIGCEEFDRTETLTANDTLTLITLAHNPNHVLGYAFAYAVDEDRNAVGFDHLIGQQLVIDGVMSLAYSINAVDFRSQVRSGQMTDIDADNILDLNGSEYESAPGELLFPRFFGQDAVFDGHLILIGLSGGREFETTADFLIMNDNEEVFSSEHTFGCWDRVRLMDISGAFGRQFLKTTDHDPLEVDVGGGNTIETGWFSVQGKMAESFSHTIPDPAMYGVYVEQVNQAANVLSGADLPFEVCKRSGHLFPAGLFGDNEEADPQGGTDCSSNLPRRTPGSLLLFPEFDNRQAAVTVFTITNTDANSGTDVHMVYLGRYSN